METWKPINDERIATKFLTMATSKIRKAASTLNKDIIDLDICL